MELSLEARTEGQEQRGVEKVAYRDRQGVSATVWMGERFIKSTDRRGAGTRQESASEARSTTATSCPDPYPLQRAEPLDSGTDCDQQAQLEHGDRDAERLQCDVSAL